MIIGLVGRARSGKDTASQLAIQAGFEPIAFADSLRDVLYAANPIIGYRRDWKRLGLFVQPIRWADAIDKFGYEGAKDRFLEIRTLQQTLGTEGIRGFVDPDAWVNCVRRKIESSPHLDHVVTDVRFPDEAAFVKGRGGVLIKVERDSVQIMNHDSEALVDLIECDYVIQNNGTLEDLTSQVSNVLREVITRSYDTYAAER